jgi:hypothetical protein
MLQNLKRMLLLEDASADQRIGVIAQNHAEHGPAALGEDRGPGPHSSGGRAPEVALADERVPGLDLVRVADGDVDLSIDVSNQHVALASGEFPEFVFADRGHRHGWISWVPPRFIYRFAYLSIASGDNCR